MRISAASKVGGYGKNNLLLIMSQGTSMSPFWLKTSLQQFSPPASLRCSRLVPSRGRAPGKILSTISPLGLVPKSHFAVAVVTEHPFHVPHKWIHTSSSYSWLPYIHRGIRPIVGRRLVPFCREVSFTSLFIGGALCADFVCGEKLFSISGDAGLSKVCSAKGHYF